MPEPTCIGDTRALLGEGPLWHEGRLYWLDLEGRSLHAYNYTSTQLVCRFDFRVSAIVPRKRGGFLLASERGFCSWDGAGKPTLVVDPEQDRSDTRFNDGKCDAAGRFWAGTMGYEAESDRGAVYRLDADFSCRRILAPTTISNGMAWDKAGTTWYFIDSPTRTVRAYPYDIRTGEIGTGRPVITFTEADGWPDGMTIDDHDRLWVALWGSGRVVCCNPLTGRILNEIYLPVSQVTSCTFGGAQLDELYITTARIGLPDEKAATEPLAGGLFRVAQPGARGLVPACFAG